MYLRHFEICVERGNLIFKSTFSNLNIEENQTTDSSCHLDSFVDLTSWHTKSVFLVCARIPLSSDGNVVESGNYGGCWIGIMPIFYLLHKPLEHFFSRVLS